MPAEVIQFVPGLKKSTAEQRRQYDEYCAQLARYGYSAQPDTTPSEYTAPSDDCA